jgi:alkylation response protein AidB-like acyl-CoA dehydrogenase
MDRVLWAGLTDIGVFSMLVPEQHGGLGLTFVDLALVVEEFGRALVPASVLETIAATDVLVRYGSAEQAARLLPLIGEGRLEVAAAVAEADAGFDPAEMVSIAKPVTGGWSLHGRKVLTARAAHADVLLALVRFGDRETPGLVLLEKDRAGVQLREQSTLDLLNSYHEVTFDNVKLTRDDVVGGEPLPAAAMRLLDVGAMLAAAQLLGIAAKVLDNSVAFANQRVQFGKPIGSFQAIKHRCADMAVMVDASRSAAYYAAWSVAEDADNCAKAVSLAKSFCGDSAKSICNEGIQVHGGIGFTWELGLHFYLRRARMLEQTYGDASFHRERVLAATLSKEGILSA